MAARAAIVGVSGLRAGFSPSVSGAAGQLTCVRGSRYGPTCIEPISTDREELKSFRETPEGKEASFRRVKATRSDVSNSVFYDPLLDKFINQLMRKGDKKLATDLVHKALYAVKFIKPAEFSDPLAVLEAAVNNVRPSLETTPIKRGGQTYQVPVPVKESRSRLLAIRWLIESAAEKERHIRFYNQLAKELVDAANNVGRVIRRKREQHKYAESNKAFAHYRWS